MMICDAAPNSRVCPSGAARATRVAPIVPLAPATFSMMTGCPSLVAMRSLTMREYPNQAVRCYSPPESGIGHH